MPPVPDPTPRWTPKILTPEQRKAADPNQLLDDQDWDIASRIRPTFGKCLIRPINEDQFTKTSGGLILPPADKDDIKGQQCVGFVVAVADPSDLDERMVFRVGDLVMYSRLAGHAVNLEERSYRTIRQTEIHAIVLDPTIESTRFGK